MKNDRLLMVLVLHERLRRNTRIRKASGKTLPILTI